MQQKAKDRGYGPDKLTPAEMALVDDVAERWGFFLEDHGHSILTNESRVVWLKRFAEKDGVPLKELAKKVGIKIEGE